MTVTERFSGETVLENPFDQFDLWYRDHLSSGQAIPEYFSLATSTPDGRVSVRIVLLKDHDRNGFTFFTNYNSRKGMQLLSNPNAAMLFYWPESGRQVRIEGRAEKTSDEVSSEYFRTRPRESQIAAWASEQSSKIPDRKFLENNFDFYEKAFASMPVDKPGYWGGFRIIPHYFEFWENREHRLHDRIIYSLEGSNWLIDRLSP